MLDPRWRKIGRDLTIHKARTLMVVVAIAVGIAGAGAVLNAWALIERVTREDYLGSNPPSVIIRTDSVDADLLASVRRLPGVRFAEGRRTIAASARVDGGWRGSLIFVSSALDQDSVGRVKSESGVWPPGDGELVIERSSLSFSGISVGTGVELLVGDREPFVLQAAGIARDVGLAPGWMEHIIYAFASPATAVRLGLPSSLDELRIVVTDRSLDQDGVRPIAARVEALVEATGRRVTDVEVPVPGEHIHAAQMNSLLFTQGAFGAMALILSAFLVVNLMAAMLGAQVREIGVMKALGGRSEQLMAMYLALAAVLGVLATAIGVPLAAAIGRPYASFRAELLNFDLGNRSIPIGIIVLEVLVGIVVPVAAAWLPVRRGCRVSVGEALRDLGIRHRVNGGRSFEAFAGAGRPVLLSLRNAFRRRQRMVLTLLALAMGGSVFLAARNLRAAIRASVDDLFAPQRFQLSVRLDAPHAIDSIESTLEAVPSVLAAEAWTGTRAGRVRSDGSIGNAFSISAPAVPSELLAYPMLEGRWLGADDAAELVVGRGLVRADSAYRVGATIELSIGGRSSRWKVVGVVESGPGLQAFAPRGAVQGVLGRTSVDRAVLALAPGSNEILTIQRIRSSLSATGFDVVATQMIAESRRVIEDHLLMVADFLGAMAWVMIVIGALGLGSTMSLAVLERTREIGVMKALGARRRSILAIVEIEALVIAVLSWLAAVPISVPISVALGRVFGRIMLPVPDRFLPELSGVGIWLALSLGVAMVAAAWPAVRATRITVARAIAYE